MTGPGERASDSPESEPTRADGPGSVTEEKVLAAVAAFVAWIEARVETLGSEGVADGLAEFLTRYPEALRPAIHRHCRAHLAVLQTFGRPGPDPAEGSTTSRQQFGQFEIIEELGRGGMGVVYLAEQTGLARRVALKMLAPSFATSTTHKARFRREAAAAGSLQHRGIVPVHASGEIDGALFYAMEYVPGSDLAQVLEGLRRPSAQTPATGEHPRRPGSGSRVGPKERKQSLGVVPGAPYPVEVATLVALVCDALHYAHEREVIHRDMKPGNVLLGADGQPRILDFGLAKTAESGDLAMTRSGDLTGTPFYMSPEQTLARRAPVDARSDVFSTGVILYELLTLERPFVGEDLQSLVFQICFGEPPLAHRVAPDVPRDLAVICAKAIEKDPRRRYATAAEMAADLRRFTGFRPVLARPSSPRIRVGKWVRRHRGAVVAAVLALFAILLVATVHWVRTATDRAALDRHLAAAADAGERREFEAAQRALDHAAALGLVDPRIEWARAALRAEQTAQADRAERVRLDVQRLRAQSALERERDPSLGLALAVEAAELAGADSAAAEAAGAILGALSECVPTVELRKLDQSPPAAMAWSPRSGSEGEHAFAVSAGPDHTPQIWVRSARGDVESRTLPWTVLGSRRGGEALALAAEGEWLALDEGEAGVGLWSLPAMTRRCLADVDGARVQRLALSADGSRMVVATRGEPGRGPGRLGWFAVRDDQAVPMRWLRLDRPVASMSYHGDRDSLLVQFADRGVQVFNGEAERIVDVPGRPGPPMRPQASACWALNGRAFAHIEDRGRRVVVRSIDEPEQPVAAFSFAGNPSAMTVSNDGAIVAVGCEDRTARLWHIEEQRELRVISGQRGPITELCVTGLEGLVVTASDDRTVAVHEVATGRRVAWLPQPGRVLGLCCSPDAGRVIARYDTHHPRLFDLRVERPAFALDAHRGQVQDVAFEPAGRWLATSGRDGFVRVWRSGTGARVAERRLGGLGRTGPWLAMGSDRVRVLGGDMVSAWSLPGLEPVGAVVRLPRAGGGRGPVGPGRRPSPNRARGANFGIQSVSFGRSGAASGPPALFVANGALWHWSSAAAPVRVERGPVDSVQTPRHVLWGPNAGQPAVDPPGIAPAGEIFTVSARGDVTQVGIEGVVAAIPAVTCWASSADALRIGVGTEHGFSVWLREREPSRPWRRVSRTRPPDSGPWVGPDAQVTACAWANGQWVVGRGGGTVEVLDADGIQSRLRWRPHRAAIRAIDISPDQHRVATVSDDHFLRVWPLRPLVAARRFGVRPLRYAERERLGLLTDADRIAWAWVSELYDELILARDVVSAVRTRALPSADVSFGEEHRALVLRYATERSSPSAAALHQRAFRVLTDPERDLPSLQRGLREIRAAVRLQPREAGHRILEALGHLRGGAPAAALDAVVLGLGLPGEKRVALGHSIRALALAALGRQSEAKSAVRQLRQQLHAGRRGPRAGARAGRRSEPSRSIGARPWVERALALFD